MIKHGFRRLKWVSAGLIALIKHVSLTLLAVLILFLGVRVYQTERGPDLQLWHTWHGEEMSAKTLESATFAQYQAHEARLFDALKVEISDKLGAETSKRRSTATGPEAGFILSSLRRTEIVHSSCCRRGAAWRGGHVAWFNRLAVQPEARGAALPAVGVYRRRTAFARTRHRPRSAD